MGKDIIQKDKVRNNSKFAFKIEILSKTILPGWHKLNEKNPYNKNIKYLESLRNKNVIKLPKSQRQSTQHSNRLLSSDANSQLLRSRLSH